MNDESKLDVQIRERFDRPDMAASYADRKNVANTWKNRREMSCIQRAFEGVPAGSKVLDLPTGTGRLLPMLVERGYQVTAADYSSHMLEQAQKYFAGLPGQSESGDSPVLFSQQNVMSIDLPDKFFDVTVSNRLFHHYPTSELRRAALAELARVTAGRIVLSYFSNWAFSALRFHIKNRLLGRKPVDRVPIWPAELAADIKACGLKVVETYPVRFGLSPQTYLVLVPTVN